MNLKQNIDNTNELKNKVKLTNTRIKETVIRGGYDFKSLDKAPERIKKMLGQYNKIAIGNIKESCMLGMNESKNITVNTNFECKYVFLKINPAGEFGNPNPTQVAFLNATETTIQVILNNARYKIEKVNSKTFKLIGRSSSSRTFIFIDSFVAIG